jgi:hypothetical protein
VYIVTHTAPDLDAIGAAWLLQRYGGLAEAEVRFVNTGRPDPALLDGAAAVVDTGRAYDPARRRFDHHHLPGAAANATCSALQVWTYLRSVAAVEQTMRQIKEVINLIYAGDTGRNRYGAKWSRSIGLHALLAAQQAHLRTDAELLAFGYQLLDLIAEHLIRTATAGAELEAKTVYRSKDGRLIAVRDSTDIMLNVAYEQGVTYVLFASQILLPDGKTTHAVGLCRRRETAAPDCGELVTRVEAASDDQMLHAELARWFRHPAGFFAGRGTEAAPRFEPVAVPLAEIARLDDAARIREG